MKSDDYTTPVITLRQKDTIHDAIIKMHQNNIKRIVITSDDTRKDIPIGIVTERDIVRFLYKDKTERALDEVPLNEIVSRNLVTITASQNDHITQCALRMQAFQISSIIVVDDGGELVGITTETDVAKSFSQNYVGSYKVKDYMTREVFTCREFDFLEFALKSLNENKVSRLVVTSNRGKPVGIVTYNTFLRHSEYFKLGTKPKTRNYLIPNESSSNLLVRDLMNNELLTVEAEDDLARAAALMIQHNVSGIPVIGSLDSGELVGIVSKHDIAKACGEVKIHKALIKKDTHFS